MFIFLFRLFFFFSIILFALRKGVSFSRKITALFLFSVYSLAFLLSPYWLIFIQSDKRVFAVITLLFIGLFCSSSFPRQFSFGGGKNFPLKKCGGFDRIF